MKSIVGGISQVEIGNLLENFKIDILISLASQLDILNIKQKQVEAKKHLSIFCSKCREKHPLTECPLNRSEAYGICE